MKLKLYLNSAKESIVKYELLTERSLFEQLSTMEQITLSEIGTLEDDPKRTYEIVDTDFLSEEELTHYLKICSMIAPVLLYQEQCFSN